MKGGMGQAERAIKTATRLLIDELGGVEAAASVARVGKSQISDYASPNAEKFMPADVVAELERIARVPHVTTALAVLAGCVLMPTRPLAERSALAAILAEYGRETGELFATAATALGHGRLSDAERGKLLEELSEISRTVNGAIAFLRADAPGGVA